MAGLLRLFGSSPTIPSSEASTLTLDNHKELQDDAAARTTTSGMNATATGLLTVPESSPSTSSVTLGKRKRENDLFNYAIQITCNDGEIFDIHEGLLYRHSGVFRQITLQTFPKRLNRLKVERYDADTVFIMKEWLYRGSLTSPIEDSTCQDQSWVHNSTATFSARLSADNASQYSDVSDLSWHEDDAEESQGEATEASQGRGTEESQAEGTEESQEDDASVNYNVVTASDVLEKIEAGITKFQAHMSESYPTIREDIASFADDSITMPSLASRILPDRPQTAAIIDVLQLTKTCILANELDMPDLEEDALSALVMQLRGEVHIPTAALIYAYDHADAGSEIRKLLVQFTARYVEFGRDELAATFATQNELLLDLVCALKPLRTTYNLSTWVPYAVSEDWLRAPHQMSR